MDGFEGGVGVKGRGGGVVDEGEGEVEGAKGAKGGNLKKYK